MVLPLCKLTKSVFIYVIFIARIGLACSAFSISHGNQSVMGKNYDWDLDIGLVIVNKPNMVKTAMGSNNPAHWKSKYGSVTFNQYGCEFPMGGMNEAGLAIEVMWLSGAEYPPKDLRPEIDNLQWIQFQLDKFSSVEEVIASDTLIRIAPLSQASIHYLICDSKGSCVTIEYIDGKRVCFTGDKMPVKVLTNDTYRKSVDFLKIHRGFGGKLPIPKGSGSLDRFIYASYMAKNYDSKKSEDMVKYAFDILKKISMGDYTKWSIVYDIGNCCVRFKTSKKEKVKKINLKSLDFSCKNPLKIININTNLYGDITNNLENYSYQKNKKLIKNSFSKTYFLKDLPEDFINKVITYPQSVVCE